MYSYGTGGVSKDCQAKRVWKLFLLWGIALVSASLLNSQLNMPITHTSSNKRYTRDQLLHKLRVQVRTNPLQPLAQSFEHVMVASTATRKLLPTQAFDATILQRKRAVGLPRLSK